MTAEMPVNNRFNRKVAVAAQFMMISFLCACFFIVVLRFPPRTVIDLLLITGPIISFAVAAGAMPLAWRAIVFGGLIFMGGILIGGVGLPKTSIRGESPAHGFEINVAPTLPGVVRLDGLYVDGTSVNLKQLVVRGEFSPFSTSGLISADNDLIIRYDRPFEHAHIDYVTNTDGAGLLIADRTAARALSTQAQLMTAERYYFSVWEIGPQLGDILLAIGVALGGFLLTSGERVRTQQSAIFIAVGCVVCGMQLGAFPGLFSPDSADQYNQCTTGSYFDRHSIAVSVLACGTRYFVDSPVVFVALQMGVYGLVILHVVYGLERRFGCYLIGDDGIMVRNGFRLIVMFVAFCPVALPQLAVFGQDTPFGICLFFAVALIGQVIIIKVPIIRWLAFCAALFGVVLFRPNGVIFPVLLLAIAAFFRFEGRRNAVLASLGALAVLVTFKLLILILGIPGADEQFLMAHTFALPIHTIGYAVWKGTLSDPAQLTVAQSLFDIEKLRAGYNPYDFSSIQFNGTIRYQAFPQIVRPLLSTWLDLLVYQPSLAMVATFKFGWMIFMPIWSPNLHLILAPMADADSSNLWSMVKTAPPFSSLSLAPTFSDMTTTINIMASYRSFYHIFLPSTSFWSSVALLSATGWLRTRRSFVGMVYGSDASLFVAISACLLFMFATGFIIPAPHMRYTWWIYPLAAMTLGLAISSLATRLGYLPAVQCDRHDKPRG